MDQELRQVGTYMMHSLSDKKVLASHGCGIFTKEPPSIESPSRKKQSKRPGLKHQNTENAKKTQHQHLSQQYRPTMEPINEDSNGSLLEEFSIFSELNVLKIQARQERKRTTNTQRLNEAEGLLIRQISIIGPSRVKCSDISGDPYTYRYERAKKVFSSEPPEKQMRNYHYTFAALESLYRMWRQDQQSHEFYLICGKHTLYFTHHLICRDVPVLLLHSDHDNIQKLLQHEQLRYHSHSDNPYSQLYSLYGGNITLFYKAYVRDILKKELPFEAIANFKFSGSSEHMPRELFNGPQNRQHFAYLLESMPKKEASVGLFGERIERPRPLYLCKFQGYFFHWQLVKLSTRLKTIMDYNEFELQCEAVKQTDQFHNVLRGPLPSLWNGTTEGCDFKTPAKQ